MGSSRLEDLDGRHETKHDPGVGRVDPRAAKRPGAEPRLVLLVSAHGPMSCWSTRAAVITHAVRVSPAPRRRARATHDRAEAPPTRGAGSLARRRRGGVDPAPSRRPHRRGVGGGHAAGERGVSAWVCWRFVRRPSRTRTPAPATLDRDLFQQHGEERTPGARSTSGTCGRGPGIRRVRRRRTPRSGGLGILQSGGGGVGLAGRLGGLVTRFSGSALAGGSLARGAPHCGRPQVRGRGARTTRARARCPAPVDEDLCAATPQVPEGRAPCAPPGGQSDGHDAETAREGPGEAQTQRRRQAHRAGHDRRRRQGRA